MRLASAAFALAVTLGGVASAAETLPPRLIVTAQQAEAWKIAGRSCVFTPTQAEVDQADAALQKALVTSTEFGVETVRARWPNYGRQYLGVMNKGRRVIVINAFCSSPFADPTEEYVVVIDGGACFFHAWYDIQADRVTGIAVNGYA